MILHLGADSDARDQLGRTALIWAAGSGWRDTVEVLLDIGKADVNAGDYRGCTALMYAAEFGRRDTVEVLLDTGIANINHGDNQERTVLIDAVTGEDEEIVKLLLSTGKVEIYVEGQCWTALEQAKCYGLTTIANLLESYSASSQ